jgi:hypothetical protein
VASGSSAKIRATSALGGSFRFPWTRLRFPTTSSLWRGRSLWQGFSGSGHQADSFAPWSWVLEAERLGAA